MALNASRSRRVWLGARRRAPDFWRSCQLPGKSLYL